LVAAPITFITAAVGAGLEPALCNAVSRNNCLLLQGPSSRLHGAQCLAQIGDQIIGMFNPYRKTDHCRPNPKLKPFFRIDIGVRHGCRMLG
jgi:hypothetical protein